MKISATVLLLLFLAAPYANGQDEMNVIRGASSNNRWIDHSDARNSLYHHLAREAYRQLDVREERVAALQTLDEWKSYQDQVRETLHRIIGPFPERTPLHARMMRTVQMDGYRMEHIVYESLPGFFVTSTLYVPHGIAGKRPAVVYLSGHTQEGYRSSTYQHKIINLVKKGFIVYAIDPVGQGERLEYYDAALGHSIVGSPTREHSYAGVQAFIAGRSQAFYMIWDIIRGIDYLVTRKEVDSDRLGMTGRSGGGTQTSYVAALDDRIYAAAPEAYITSFRRLLQSIGPQDAEQNLHHGLLNGIDHADFLLVRAPRPTLNITTSNDFFSVQGARETAKEVSRIYEAYGRPENFSVTEDFGRHESTQSNREAMYAFFLKHLGQLGSPRDQQVRIPSEEELRVTPTGQVATSFGGETVYSLVHKEAETRMQELRTSRRNLEDHLPRVLTAARELTGYRDPGEAEPAVYAGLVLRQGYEIRKYFIPGEGDYVIPFLLMVPRVSNGRAVIYLDPAGKSSPAREGGSAENWVRGGYTVLVPDLAGIGELGDGEMANYHLQLKSFDPVSFDVWMSAVLTGRSITGIRASDTVRLVRWLQKTREPEQIHSFARADMAPVLLHAAVFEPLIASVSLERPYASFRSLVTERFYDPGFHLSAVAGSIGVYDLPDMAAALAPRELRISQVTDGAGRVVDTPDIREDLSIIRAAYEQAGSTGQLHMDFR